MNNFHKDGTLPQNGEIFVFGSNLAGRHGAGAAKVAHELFGAVYGIGAGMMGKCYAIPTKTKAIKTLALEKIKPHVEQFLSVARIHPEKKFFITRVGCGLAGYKDKDIAPMFQPLLPNVSYPVEWKEYLQ